VAQPTTTIAEIGCEQEAALWENSLDAVIADPLPIAPSHDVIEGISPQPTDESGSEGINHPGLPAALGVPPSMPLASNLSSVSPPTVPEFSQVAVRMAPGLGGFNLDPPPQRTTPTAVDAGVAIEDILSTLLKPDLVRQPLIAVERNPITSRVGESLLVLKLSATIGIIVVALLVFPDVVGKLVSGIPKLIESWHERSGAVPSPHPAQLIIEGQKGFANEPLPLGISLKGGSGDESVTMIGLLEGTELSLGTSLGSMGWQVLAGNLDQTFVAAPANFVGTMHASVQLRSAGGQLLDDKIIRLEWVAKEVAKEREKEVEKEIEKPDIRSAGAAVSAQPAAVLPPLGAEQIDTLIKLAKELLNLGDIALARPLLKRAALAGNAQAALELAKTFDQAFLTEWGVLGLAPDAAQAREWYESARELGSIEALRHLERLASLPN
jgi:hypothetical protein